ncbi:MAG: T9SS type A sorting domain-containing protein [Bacteroidota bacterium]
MHRRLSIIAVFLLVSLGALGQARIGFSHLNGFPSLIVQGNAYTVSGHLINTGQSPLTAPLDIYFAVGNGPAVLIESNVNLGTIAPGDSVLWTKSGHHFPGAQFSPGNNDVLIWPTRAIGPGNVQIESVKKQKSIFFIAPNTAAFRINPQLGGFTTAVPLTQPINLTATAENVGDTANSDEVAFYLSYNGLSPVRIDADGQAVPVGNTITFVLSQFILLNHLPYTGGEFPNGMVGEVTFFVAETDGLAPVNSVSFPISVDNVTAMDPAAVAVTAVYPSPATDVVQLDYRTEVAPLVTGVEVYDLNGQIVRSFPAAVSHISLGKLAAGKYWLLVRTEAEVEVHAFIKQ